MNTHACKQVHKRLQPHSDYSQRLTVESPQADLLSWKYRLFHLSFKFIKAIAEVGLLPKNLTKSPIPDCAGCIFAAMTKKPWQSKGKNTVGRVG